MIRKCRRVFALTIVTFGLSACAAVLFVPGTAVAGNRHCPSMTAKGTRFRVTIKRGKEVKCSTADSVLRTFLSGHGTMHGPANGPAYLQTWTVPYGWTCGYGTGGGACIRGGSSSQNAHDWIEAQEQ